MNYTRKAVRGAGFVFVVSLLAAFLAYLFRLLLARNLTQTEYGLFYAVYGLLIFSTVFNNLGTSQALVKFIPEFKVKKRFNSIKNSIIYVAIIQLIISILIAFVLILFSDFLALNYFRNPQASLIIELFAIIFLLRPFTSLLTYIFQGFQRMKYFASVDFLRTSFILIITFLGFKLAKTVLVPTFAYLFTPIILLIILVPLLLKKVFPEFLEIKFTLDKKLIKKLIFFGFPLIFMSIGGLILNYTDTVMLTYFSGLKQVGLYNAALPTANILGYFSIALMAVVFPLTAELWARGHKEQLLDGINLLYRYSFIVILPLALTIFSFPEIILNILFGHTYVPASSVLRILSLGIIVMTITRINFSAISGIGKPKLIAKIILIGAILNIILNFILIPKYGMVGAAVTTFVGYLLMMGLSVANLKKLIGARAPIKYWIKNLFLGLIFVLIIFYLKNLLVLNVYLELAIVIGIAGIIYSGLVFALKLITITEIKELIKRVI